MLRERQILGALRDGISDPTKIVERIYPRLATPLVPVARESVVAHLLKLEKDGVTRRDGEAWHIIDP